MAYPGIMVRGGRRVKEEDEEEGEKARERREWWA
jgi:hypothetical protein